VRRGILATVLIFAIGAVPAGGGDAPRRGWFRGDLHVHTARSHDTTEPVASVIAKARARGLDFIALTDHDVLPPEDDAEARAAAAGKIEVIGGVEWTSFSHAAFLGARALPPRFRDAPGAGLEARVEGALEAARAAGAVIVLAHPAEARFPWLLDVRGADAVEVWNGFWAVSNAGLRALGPAALERAAALAGVTPSALIERTALAPGSGNDQALFYWEERLERGERLAAVGGSDHHGWFQPGAPATWVLAPSARAPDVLAAIREGRTVVTAGPEGPPVTLEAGDAVVGGVVPAGRKVAIRARVEAKKGMVLQVLKRRRVVAEVAIDADGERALAFEDTPAPGDWYRADLYRPVDGAAAALDRSWRWPGFARAAITSPIYAR
jgi:hypothetical protein